RAAAVRRPPRHPHEDVSGRQLRPAVCVDRRVPRRVDGPEDVPERCPARVRNRDVTHLAELALFTDDVAALSAFYGQLAGADPVAEWQGGALFALGDTKILVHERSEAPADGPPNEDHLALAVGDLNGVYEALRAAGVTFLVGPRDYPWGRSAYLRDPDGRLVEIAQA